MEPVPGHGCPPRGIRELRGHGREGGPEAVRLRYREDGAPEAHPRLRDGLRVDPVVLRRHGKHAARGLHRLAGEVPHVGPPRAAPADHERADAVLLVHDGKRAAAGLVEQGVDVLLPVLHAPADPDLAVGIQPDGPVEGPAGIHAEIELVGAEPVFLPALHGGSLLLGWQEIRLREGDTHIALPRGMPGGTSLSAVSRGPPSSGSSTPGPSGEAGTDGCPEAAGQQPHWGHLQG